MRTAKKVAAACVAAIATIGVAADRRDLGREVLAPNDGFAALGEGVTGGADADADHVFVVRNRAELVAALTAAPAGAPRITAQPLRAPPPRLRQQIVSGHQELYALTIIVSGRWRSSVSLEYP